MRIADLIGGAIITVAAGCVVSVLATVGWLAMPAIRAQMGLAPSVVQSYAVGTTIDVPASVYEASPYTAVLFAEESCGVCQRVKPWLTNVLAQLRRRPGVHLVMMTRGRQMDEELRYAGQLGLGSESVVRFDLKSLHLQQVPTLVLVDREGVVRYAQQGAPLSEAEATLAALRSVTEER